MQEMNSQDITKLAKALLNVQRQMLPAAKDATNPFTKSKYATLNSVMAASREALLENGIWMCQCPVPVDTPGSIGLLTKLTHTESGQWQSSLAVVPLPKADPQGMGSAITYARRYALTAMLGLVSEDDDGEAACGRKGSATRPSNPRRQGSNRQEAAPEDSELPRWRVSPISASRRRTAGSASSRAATPSPRRRFCLALASAGTRSANIGGNTPTPYRRLSCTRVNAPRPCWR